MEPNAEANLKRKFNRQSSNEGGNLKTLEEAKKSLARVTFTEDQRARSQKAWSAVEGVLEAFFETASPSAELTLACRALEEASMWHSKAISNETKMEAK